MADFTSRILATALRNGNLSVQLSQDDNDHVIAGNVLGLTDGSGVIRLAKCAPASEVRTPFAIALQAGRVGLVNGVSLGAVCQSTGVVSLPKWPIASDDGTFGVLSTLTPSTTHYLSPALPGYLCATAPFNDPSLTPGPDVDKIPFVIGTAISTTKLSLVFARLPINKWPTSLGGADLETNASALAFPAALSQAVVAGAAVYINGDNGTTVTVANAKADNETTAVFSGMACTAAASGVTQIVESGILSLASWLAATGSAALTPGATYYVSATTAGMLTTVAPAMAVPVGKAITANTMLIGEGASTGGVGGGLTVATAKAISFNAVAGNLYPVHGNQETAQIGSLPLAATAGNGAVCGFKVLSGAGPFWKVHPTGGDAIDIGDFQFTSNTGGSYIELTSDGVSTWYVTSLIELP